MTENDPNAGVTPLPRNPEIEAALLGAILVSNDCYFRVCRDLRPEHFSEPVHGEIYHAIEQVIAQAGSVSPLPLKHYFEANDALKAVKGGQYLFDLVANVISTFNSEAYASEIIDLWQRRQGILAMQDGIELLSRPDIDATAAQISSEVAGHLVNVMASGRSGSKTRREVMDEMMSELQAPVRADSTGIVRLDAAMAGGLHRGRAYGLVGRKKAGKSALGGTISYNLNRAGVKHLAALLEMGSISYEQRNVARSLGVNSLKFLNSKTRDNPEFLTDVGNQITREPDHTFYLDRPGLRFEVFQQQVLYHVHKHKIQGVILDYLQLLSGRDARTETLSDFYDRVTQWIAEAVKKYDIWALVLAQMNQSDNVRGGEGMRNAFDQVYAIKPAAAQKRSYLEMWDSRYTPMYDIGSTEDPLFVLSMAGPHFEEIEYDDDDKNEAAIAALAG